MPFTRSIGRVRALWCRGAKCAACGVVTGHEEGCPKAARRQRVVALGAFVAVAIYIALGIGFHRTVVACYDSRHSLDREPRVFGGPIGFVLDVALWPAFQAANGLHGIDCDPLPLN